MIRDDEEHQFVAMDHCIYCGEVKQLVMQTHFTKDGRPLEKMKQDVCTGPEPCDACKKKGEEEGSVLLVESDGKSFGPRYIKIKREAVKGEEFIKCMEEHGFLLCDSETMNQLTKGA